MHTPVVKAAVPMEVMTTQRLYKDLTVVTSGHGHQHGYHQAKFEWT